MGYAGATYAGGGDVHLRAGAVSAFGTIHGVLAVRHAKRYARSLVQTALHSGHLSISDDTAAHCAVSRGLGCRTIFHA